MLNSIKLLLQKDLWQWIGQNRATFIIVVLLLGNVYQYYDNNTRSDRYQASIEQLNHKISEINKNSLQYERERSNSLESLLQALVVKYNTLDSANKAKSK